LEPPGPEHGEAAGVMQAMDGYVIDEDFTHARQHLAAAEEAVERQRRTVLALKAAGRSARPEEQMLSTMIVFRDLAERHFTRLFNNIIDAR
jgi:hypothetical protein